MIWRLGLLEQTARMMHRLLLSAATVVIGMLWGQMATAQDDFSLEDEVAFCASCHGEAGLPEDPSTPIIWGQEFYYLYVQLRDYGAGRRANAVMQPIAEQYSKDQMQALAQYYSEMQWPGVEFQADENLLADAEASLSVGQCARCHGAYKGDSRVPRLAGQHLEYLERTMLDFKRKVRLNAPAKGTIIGSFSDEQIQAMADYLAGLWLY